jgi:hypothetical protein
VLRRLLVTLATAALVAGPSLAQAAPAQRAGNPGFHQPAVGECHRLTATQSYAEADPKAPVDCARTHTSQTVAVVRLTGTPDWDDTAATFAKVSTRCYRALDKALGSTASVRAKTTYDLLWFYPTKAERKAGARWVRCDAFLRAGRGVAVLPDAPDPMLSVPLSDGVAACLTGKSLVKTVCARSHSFRATGTTRTTFKKYPTLDQVRRLANAKCPQRTTSKRWAFSYVDGYEWTAGRRQLVCYTQTRK